MAYSSTKLAVKDNYEEDEASDDVDDEVFIRDGRNGYKVDEERGVKRPLMAPRRKTKGSTQLHTETCKKPPCNTFCAPCCYGFIALCALLGLIVLITMVINMFPLPLERIRSWTVGHPKKEKTIIPCTELNTQEVWSKMYPKLVSEAPIKVTDVNSDGVDDIIIGYGTGADDIEFTGISCEKYFGHPMSEPCMGGVMALNGQTGETLWQRWTIRSVLYLDCSGDVSNDKINDCLISGKGGMLSILNGKTGDVIWEIDKSSTGSGTTTGVPLVNVYTAQFISDVDYDGVPDVLASHLIDSLNDPSKFDSHLIVYSGKSKAKISQVNVPGDEIVLDAPQVLVSPDGTNTVVFTTGDASTYGNTYCAHLHNIVKGDMSKYVLLNANGNSVSPVLVDMNNDGSEDIVTANGAFIAVFDGITLNQIWNTSITSSTTDLLNTYISPTPAYFNDDLIPDILVTQLAGPDAVHVYYSQISVLDGRNGQNLLEKPIIGSSSVDSPAVTVSYQGIGNDYFLFWYSACIGHENDKQPYNEFRDNVNIREERRTDFCRVRFNSSKEIRLYALSQHLEPPGVLIYSTELKWESEHNNTGRSEEPEIFVPDSHNSPPLLNNYRRKGLPQVSSHRNNNYKTRPQYPQEINPSGYGKEQIYIGKLPNNYPYYRDRTGAMQEQWPPVPVQVPQDQLPYGDDIYRANTENDPRLLPQLLKNIDEMQYEGSYNDDNDELLGGPLANDKDRDERESLQEINDRRREEAKKLDNARHTNSNDETTQMRHRLIKRSSNERQNRKESLSRVTAAASLTKGIDDTEAIDIVFVAYWVPASERDMILLTPADLQCIKSRMEQSERVKYQESELRKEATSDCLAERGIDTSNLNFESKLRVDKGQLTVYRIRVNCNCTHLNPNTEACSNPLNFNRQSWPNWGGNSYFKIRQRPL